MKYEEIPYIKILEKEYASKTEIMNFLNVSKSVFEKLKLKQYKKDKQILYSINEMKSKIDNRIDIYYIQCEFVKHFPNYIINRSGDIFLIKGKILPYHLSYKLDNDGYYNTYLSNENGKKFFRVNRLVATQYITNTYNLNQVNHKDGNKLNNNVDNLEWCTSKYNIQHAYDNNLNKTGIENVKSSPVIAYRNNGEIDKIFETILSCGEYYGVNECTVRDSHSNNTTNGRCGYYFRRISKENYYLMKENPLYEGKFIKNKHARKCKENTQHIA